MSGGAWLTQDPVLLQRTGLLTRSVLLLMWCWGPPPLSVQGSEREEGTQGEAGSGCRNSWVLIEAEQGMDSVTWLSTLSAIWAICQVPVPEGHSAQKMLFAGLGLEASNGQLGETWASEYTGTHSPLGPRSCNPVANHPLYKGGKKTIREPWVWLGQTVEKCRQLIRTLWMSLERSPWAAGGTSWPTALSRPLLHPHLWLWRKVTGGESDPGQQHSPFYDTYYHYDPFNAETVLFLAIWILFKAAPQSLNIA